MNAFILVPISSIYIFAAVGKWGEFSSFARKISMFFSISLETATALSLALCLMEIILGIGLWIRPFRRVMLLAVSGLSLFFIAIVLYGKSSGSMENCDCYGIFAIKEPAAVTILKNILIFCGASVLYMKLLKEKVTDHREG